MFKRYPYTIGLLLVVSIICCLAWLLTHDACMHPLGNGLAAWWAFVNAPLFPRGPRRRGGRRGMNFDALVWQQWVILGYALLEHFILIGTLRETKAKPGAVMYQLLRLVILCALVLTI